MSTYLDLPPELVKMICEFAALKDYNFKDPEKQKVKEWLESHLTFIPKMVCRNDDYIHDCCVCRLYYLRIHYLMKRFSLRSTPDQLAYCTRR